MNQTAAIKWRIAMELCGFLRQCYVVLGCSITTT